MSILQPRPVFTGQNLKEVSSTEGTEVTFKYHCQTRAPNSWNECCIILLLIFPHQMPVIMWGRKSLLILPNITLSIPHSNRRVPKVKTTDWLLTCRVAPWNSIPGSNTQSTVAYLGPLYGKVVGVAIYSIHILYSTVNIIIFGQNWQPDKDMFVTVCICMNYFKRK